MKIKVNDVELNYQKAGAGRPLILLHGNQEDSSIFDKIMSPLSLYFTVYAIDSRGHGLSQAVKDIHYSDLVNDVAAFIRKMDLDKPDLFGFSDGGIVGLMLASQYPHLLHKLMVAGANVSPDGLEKREVVLAKTVNFFRRDPKVDMMLTEPHITSEQLHRITVPTLAVVGEKDIVKIEHTQQFSRQIPNCRIVIMPKQTHSSYVVHSLKLLPLMKDFFK